MRLFARRYDTAEPVCLEIARGKIARVARSPIGEDGAEHWPWIAPGLCDLQVNGYGGQEFSSADLTPEKVAALVEAYHAFGVTRCCPTLFTQSFEVMHHSLETIASACDPPRHLRRRVARRSDRL